MNTTTQPTPTVRTWHYSPKTGNTMPCGASDPSNCPYGGHSQDFDGSTTRKVYEAVQYDFTLVSFKKKGNEVARRFDIKESLGR